MARRGKQKESDEASATPPAAASAGTFRDLFPRLTFDLESRVYGGANPPTREPSGLSIFHQDGLVKVCLRDRNMGQVTFKAGKSVHDALAALDKALDDLTVDWRPDKFAKRE